MNDDIEVLIIGSNRNVGGIQQYIDQQKMHLKKEISARVYDTETSNGSGLRWLLIAILQTIVSALRFPFQRRPDLVHIHTAHWFSFYRATFYVLFSKFVWRIPVVLHVHGSSFDEFLESKKFIPNIFQWVGFKAANNVIVLSDYWQELIETRTVANAVTTIPNAVDPDKYKSSPNLQGATIVFISNLSERKGTGVFINAISNLVEQQDELTVRVAGSGIYADRIKALAEEYDEIHYHGFVSEAEKRELLANGSIFVLPSYAEGLPIAILEAMASGNAIVSTDVGSIPEVITEEMGRVIEPGDPETLETTLKSLCESPSEVAKMAKTNQAVIQSQYNWNHIAIELLDMYRELLSKGVSNEEGKANV